MKNAQTTDRKRIEDMIQAEPKGEVRINHKIQRSLVKARKSPHIAARDGADRQKTMYTLVHGTAGDIAEVPEGGSEVPKGRNTRKVRKQYRTEVN